MSEAKGTRLRFDRCPCCDSRDFANYFTNQTPKPIIGWQNFFYGNWSYISDIFQCVRCKYGFINTPTENMEHFYRIQDTMEYIAKKEFRVEYFQLVKKTLEQRNLLGGLSSAKILDLGCADGDWLSLWKDQSELYGTEISPDYVPLLQRKGINVVDSQNLGGLCFNIISMFDYLEHVQDPRIEISKIKTHLAGSGYLLLGVPDMGKFIASLLRQRYYLYSPMHLSYFTEDSLRYLLMRIFPEARMINIFPSPAMKADLRTLVKWLRLPLAIHSKLNIQIPFGYSASLMAIVRTGGGDGD